MRLAVTGSMGQVAASLVERGAAAGIEVQLLGRPALDLADPAGVRAAVAGIDTDVVVSAAAYTAVDKAESEPDLALQVNGAGAGAVAAGAAERGCPVIHLSTDYVFDGRLDRPYREDDVAAPTGVYGRSKLAGERAVADANPAHVILRTAWVYSPFGHNFVKTMLRLGETRTEVNVVADQLGSPTSALDIADAIIAVARALRAHPDEASSFGVFHMTGGGQATWADFAEAVFTRAAEMGRAPVAVNRITTAQYPTPARRPANSRLDTAKLARVFGIALPAWPGSVRTCVDRLLTART